MRRTGQRPRCGPPTVGAARSEPHVKALAPSAMALNARLVTVSDVAADLGVDVAYVQVVAGWITGDGDWSAQLKADVRGVLDAARGREAMCPGRGRLARM